MPAPTSRTGRRRATRAAAVPPSRSDLEAAAGRRLRDVVAPGLRILYCGINPSLYSTAVGHHFARPGNRFWKVLHGAGLTPRLLSPSEDRTLLHWGQGITNLVPRTTGAADDLEAHEIHAGARVLARKVRRLAPRRLVFVGIGAYRIAVGRPRARIGRQEPFAGIETWALPNPSGRTAGYSLTDLIDLYRILAVDPIDLYRGLAVCLAALLAASP